MSSNPVSTPAPPALKTYPRGRLARPSTCCVEGCERASTVGAFCLRCFEEYAALSEMRAQEEARRGDPARLARSSARWRFWGSFALIFALELLIGDCLNVPMERSFIALSLAWALMLAAIVLIATGGKKAGTGR